MNTAAATGHKRFNSWQMWGALLLVPYVLVFAVFVIYPVVYGLWVARNPDSYVRLFQDPVFPRTVVNTLIFLLVGVNLKFLIALGLSGFFVQQKRWIQSLLLLFLLPLMLRCRERSSLLSRNTAWGAIAARILRRSLICRRIRISPL